MTDKVKPRRRRRKRTKNLYFTKVHEQAIIEYCKSTSYRERSKLYEESNTASFQ